MQKIGNSSLVAEPGVGDNTTSNMDQDTDILDFFFGRFVRLECDKGDTVMEKKVRSSSVLVEWFSIGLQ